MQFTYLPSSPYTRSPVVVMFTDPASKKAHNLMANPKVSLLIHDMVPQRHASGEGGSLSAYIRNITTMAALIPHSGETTSATINGSARVVEAGSEEEGFFREKHLRKLTPGLLTAPTLQSVRGGNGVADERAEGFIWSGKDIRVVVVEIRDVRMSDPSGNATVYVIEPERNGQT
jgi:pyridoxamine 5'-phosphate oxidase-like protein